MSKFALILLLCLICAHSCTHHHYVHVNTEKKKTEQIEKLKENSTTVIVVGSEISIDQDEVIIIEDTNNIKGKQTVNVFPEVKQQTLNSNKRIKKKFGKRPGFGNFHKHFFSEKHRISSIRD